ncbi:uncharacterized protein LOC113502563 [Trichoplusia ni]|uniref:Uncharacterized protein LOC113502563 n=1 Tax=Trichoplusia ni TaxID=7111 RepID=A0A7E5WI01_TRINI|nr:uncharacterized protein LOC113502563 [Trichoplusia ni]
MSLKINIFVICVLCVALYSATDLNIGIINGQLGYQEQVKLSSIPLTVRVKNVFYTSNNTKVIKGISAVDLANTKAKVKITAGGVNFSFVNVLLNSERGESLNYLVQIYV